MDRQCPVHGADPIVSSSAVWKWDMGDRPTLGGVVQGTDLRIPLIEYFGQEGQVRREAVVGRAQNGG